MNSEYICQTCYRSRDILEALGKLDFVDGYEQCKDCHSDLEYKSAVIRQIHFDNKKKGIPYPKWLHDDLDKKGLLEKVDINKCVNKKDRAAIRKVAESFKDRASARWVMEMAYNSNVLRSSLNKK